MRRSTRWLAVAIAAASLASLQPASAFDSYSVIIIQQQYVPSGRVTSSLAPGTVVKIPDGTAASAPQLKAGDRITWTNKDSTAHTVTYLSGPKSWTSFKLLTGGSKTLIIDGTYPKGTYEYRCRINTWMRGAFKRV